MKKNMLVAVATVLLFVASCKKSDYPPDIFNGGKKAFLKEIIHGTRHYLFYYDHSGFVDSIRAVDAHTTYLYNVVHHGKRIDSVSLIQNGAIVSTHGNIQYDNKGRITQYTYYLYAIPGAPPTLNTITYHQGDMKTLTRSTIYDYSLDSFTFDQQHNLVKWIQDRPHSPNVDITFTHDAHLNPLYFIDDLFVMFTEETFFFEFIFSRHNTTRKTHSRHSVVVTDYLNQYDPYGRLVKKLMVTSNSRDSLQFNYFH